MLINDSTLRLALALAQFYLFASPKVKCILEVLFPEKRALSAGERSSAHAGPILPFFIFPGIVLPFCYFSVVRKVPEKPILFLPHPCFTPKKLVQPLLKKYSCLFTKQPIFAELGYVPLRYDKHKKFDLYLILLWISITWAFTIKQLTAVIGALS